MEMDNTAKVAVFTAYRNAIAVISHWPKHFVFFRIHWHDLVKFKFEVPLYTRYNVPANTPFPSMKLAYVLSYICLGLQIFPKCEQVPSNFETYVTYVKKAYVSCF